MNYSKGSYHIKQLKEEDNVLFEHLYLACYPCLMPCLVAFTASDLIDNEKSPLQVIAKKFASSKVSFFYLNDEELGDIMKVLARWSDIELIYKDPSSMKVRFTAALQLYEGSRAIKKTIKRIDDVKITLTEINTMTVE